MSALPGLGGVPALPPPDPDLPAIAEPERQLPSSVSWWSVEPNRRRGGELRVTLSPRTVGATSGFGGVVALKPGEAVGEHYHPYSEEFLHLVRGEATLRLDGQVVTVAAGHSLLIPLGMRHRLENNGIDEMLAVFHLSPLAPRPELGHVDTEDVAAPGIPAVRVDGTP